MHNKEVVERLIGGILVTPVAPAHDRVVDGLALALDPPQELAEAGLRGVAEGAHRLRPRLERRLGLAVELLRVHGLHVHQLDLSGARAASGYAPLDRVDQLPVGIPKLSDDLVLVDPIVVEVIDLLGAGIDIGLDRCKLSAERLHLVECTTELFLQLLE